MLFAYRYRRLAEGSQRPGKAELDQRLRVLSEIDIPCKFARNLKELRLVSDEEKRRSQGFDSAMVSAASEGRFAPPDRLPGEGR
jgi:hypothetical protein